MSLQLAPQAERPFLDKDRLMVNAFRCEKCHEIIVCSLPEVVLRSMAGAVIFYTIFGDEAMFRLARQRKHARDCR